MACAFADFLDKTHLHCEWYHSRRNVLLKTSRYYELCIYIGQSNQFGYLNHVNLFPHTEKLH